MLRDMAKVTVKPLSIIWKIMVTGGESWKWEKGKAPPPFKGQKGASRETDCPPSPEGIEKMMEQLMLQVVASFREGKQVTGISQHGFM